MSKVNDIHPVRPRIQNIDKFSQSKLLQIVQSDNASSAYSFLPNGNHPRKMKPIAKRKWFAYKWQDTNNSSYMNHINYDWKRFYDNDSIADRPIVEFTTLELKTGQGTKSFQKSSQKSSITI